MVGKAWFGSGVVSNSGLGGVGTRLAWFESGSIAVNGLGSSNTTGPNSLPLEATKDVIPTAFGISVFVFLQMNPFSTCQ